MNTLSWTIPDEIGDHLPRVKLVWLTLVSHGPMTTSEIADVTGLSVASVTRSTSELSQADVVESRPDPTNPRRNIHEVKPTAGDHADIE